MSNDLLNRFGAKFSKEAVVFREGDFGDCMYIIQEGEVTISKKGKNSDFVLAVLHQGDFFGEMTLFNSIQRVATATVSKDSLLLKIDKNSFDYMIKSNVPFAIKMIQKLCERLQRVDDQLSELIGLGEQTRMLQHLMDFWKMAGRKDVSGKNILIRYVEFIQYLKESHKLHDNDIKKTLSGFKDRELIHVKKDTQGVIYITLSPRVFSYFNII